MLKLHRISMKILYDVKRVSFAYEIYNLEDFNLY